MKLIRFCSLLLFFCCSPTSNSNDNTDDPQNENLYFPPINSEVWDTTSPTDLTWNVDELEPLLSFLEEKNTKSFMILYNGKITVEAYFNGHTNTSPWYWASAGKTLTMAVTGIAEGEALIDINTKVSDYLGNNWTSLTLDKEDLITCKNLLSMSSGLDDSLGNNVSPENLQYLADASNRWAYHNVYKKLQDIITQASGLSWNSYFNSKLKNKIGMSGIWLPSEDFNVYWSDTRSMARFGLLSLANGKWNTEQIIPESYFNNATNTSQNLNLAYGYLWWLNGKSSFRLPQTQLEFPGKLIPNAPDDLFAGLGRNDQKLYIVPSKKLVIVRMGENAGTTPLLTSSSFDNELWEKINALIN